MHGIHIKYISPDQVHVGGIIICNAHDDQHEERNAHVVSIEMDATPGVWEIKDLKYPYEYRLWLVCRHINLKNLDATGGPPFRWHRFPWNGVTRVTL